MKIICPGQLGKQHIKRKKIVDYLISMGVDIDTTPLWGREYYKAIQDADVVLNVHGDGVTEACNVRLFEVTGMGTCLLTDNLDGLEDLFEIGKEVVTFENDFDCYYKIKQLTPKLIERIAKAGQIRTLRDHKIKKLQCKKY